jgi:glycosyltransferase involved in cell wall biosynthesis
MKQPASPEQRPSSLNACIYFHPDGYITEGRQVMGRHAAGESFLRGFLEGTRGQDMWIQVDDANHVASFERIAQRHGRIENIQAVDARGLVNLRKPGLVFHPGPSIGAEAVKRTAYGHSSWSLCGITHTTCSTRVMEAIVSYHTAPLHPWDAVICTSNAVHANVKTLLDAQAAYLHERLGCTRTSLPQLPVIPLGIHCDDFQSVEADRESARQSLGIKADTLVVMFMGRLAFHAKAHPLAMYQALEQSAQDSGVSVVLLECGWHANDYIREAFSQAAAHACPSVRVINLDGRDPNQRRRAWAMADVFCSLADNIQETFGITPIEAMAAGLPVVVTDWDGYRDTVRDGIDGFRIPTLMAQAGLGVELANRHSLGIDTYDLYCGYTSSFVAVDVAATAKAFTSLFLSAELRRSMGEAGRLRARRCFDWTVIMNRYHELWSELHEIRSFSPQLPAVAQKWPASPDPFEAFAGYPTKTLRSDTKLTLVEPDLKASLQRLEQLLRLAMVSYAQPVLPKSTELVDLLRAASVGPRSAGELVKTTQANRRPLLFRALAWLIKVNLLSVVN